MKPAEVARTTPIRVLSLIALLAALLAVLLAVSVAVIGPAVAAECTQPDAPIETDRPDVTNSSIVVPVGSLQNENGIDASREHGADIFSGTNSRWRLGIAPCLEVLVDLPSYVTTFRGAGPSGFSDVAPAVKWQISPLPGKFDLSITAGAAVAARPARLSRAGGPPPPPNPPADPPPRRSAAHRQGAKLLLHPFGI